MGSRRQHLFVLLFVVALVAVSAIVIASKETKLGLDLQGGLQLVYEGQPTGTATEVSGEDIEDSINIIEKRINNLGVSEAEVARLGNKNITVGLPASPTPTAPPNRWGRPRSSSSTTGSRTCSGRERVDRRPPGPAAAARRDQKSSKKNGKKPGATSKASRARA